MSHLAPQAALFSPSVARAAASTAKDWAYVDSWLRRQQQASLPKSSTFPSFERNPETLETLLSLIAANESADEERDRLARLEADALAEIRSAEQDKALRRQQQQGNYTDGDLIAEDLLEAIDAGLTKEGLTALDALADVAITLDAARDPSPANLAARFVELQGRLHEAENLLYRLGLLQSYIADETARLTLFVEELRDGPQYQLPANLQQEDGREIRRGGKTARGTSGKALQEREEDLQSLERTVNLMASRLPELQRHVESLEKAIGTPSLTVQDVKEDEESYLDLLSRKKEVDAQVKAFAGLPPDVEAARAELENLRAQLRDATEMRDANFESLVERESPVKVRRTSKRY
ncbi:hypothetical protein F4808DRAFT_253031 [Astrocystis sublimbata]|nr:hypothetical protein F4808DRAFT_253031 [Astrocystis sublimbata]